MPFYDLRCTSCKIIDKDVYTSFSKIIDRPCSACGERTLKVIVRVAPRISYKGLSRNKSIIGSKQELGWTPDSDKWFGEDGKS